MKKFAILFVMLFFAGTQFVMAQQQTQPPPPPQQPQQMNPVREYIRKNILPVVKQEHGKFINALTSSEKQELTKIQNEFKNLRPGPGMRGADRPQMKNTRAKVQELMEQTKKIADAHPKAATAYQEAIEAKKAVWTKAIQEIREKNAMGYGLGMNANKTPFIIERVSDPAFGLLFDGKIFPMHMRPGMRPGGRPGMGPGRTPGMRNGNYSHRGMYKNQMAMGMRCNYGRTSRGMGYYHQMGRGYCTCYGNFGRNGRFSKGMMHPGMMQAMDPEIKKELKAFAEKNIFPVLNKERAAFDKELKSSEKRDIENARKNIAAVRAQMKKYWQDTTRVPGRRVNDSARMAMRLELQKNMLVVREIALKHYSELHASLNNLKEYLPKWKAEMHKIMFNEMKNKGYGCPMGMGRGYGKMMPPRHGRMMAFNHRRGMFGGVRFLLYDPANPGNTFFHMNN